MGAGLDPPAVAGPPGAVGAPPAGGGGVVIPPRPSPPCSGHLVIEQGAPPTEVIQELTNAGTFFSSGFAGTSRPSSSLIWDIRASQRNWSRANPFPQCTFRFDGKNVRDGAGLGSPAFWFPERFAFLDCAAKLRVLIDSAACDSGFPDFLNDFALDIAGLSADERETQFKALREKSEETADLLLDRLRRFLPEFLLPGKSPGQPFRLEMLAAISRAMGDPDCDFPLRGVDGWHLGSEIPVDDSGLWPLKSLKQSEVPFEERCLFSYQLWSENYRSFSEFFDLASAKVASDVDLGFAEKPGSWSNLCARVGLDPLTPLPSETAKKGLLSGPDDFAAARLGAVPQGDSVRVVVDGTIGGVNPRCVLPETQQTPGLADVLSGLDSALPTWYALKVDVKSAYKRLKLLFSDWRRAIFSIGGEWYFYKVLPFGLKASGYWWNRFNSLIHRVIHAILSDVAHGGFVYVDDSLWLVAPDVAFKVFSRVFAFLTLIGVPLSWEKTQIGFVVDWVGFEVDFRSRRVSLSDVKRKKLSTLIDESFSGKSVHISVLQTVGGFMSWASALVPTSRPLLWPIFRAIYAASTRPDQRVFDMRMIRATTRLWRFIIVSAASFVPRNLRLRSPALLRVDACADSQGAWLGGWFLSNAQSSFASIRWFACQVPLSIFPEEKQREQSFISACEMLALAVGVRLWGKFITDAGHNLVRLQSDSMVSVLSCGSDYAKSPNMAFALRELIVSELAVGLEVEVQHIPGVSNVLADAISRRFSWIWDCLPLANQEQVGLASLIPFALSCIDTEEHDPFVGVVVGNAKKPGPSSRTDMLEQLAHSGYSPEFCADFFALLSDATNTRIDMSLPVCPSEVIGRWHDRAVMPLPQFRAAALQLFAWASRATQTAFWESYRGMGAASVPVVPTRTVEASRGERLRPFPSGGIGEDSQPPTKRKLSPGGRSRAIAREATEAVSVVRSSFISVASRSSAQKAKALQLAADPIALRTVVADLKYAYFADSTWRAHASEVRLYVEISDQAEVSPWPISYVSMVTFVAVLKHQSYKSVAQYVAAVKRQQALSGTFSAPEDKVRLDTEMPMMLRAAKRDRGEPRHVEAITEEHLLRIRSGISSIRERYVWDLLTLEWFFLLRSAEALALSPDAISFLLEGVIALPGSALAREQNVQSFSAAQVVEQLSLPGSGSRFRVRIRIKKDKTNQQRKDIHRFLDCVCREVQLGVACPPFCPVHCAARLCLRHKGTAGGRFNSGFASTPIEPAAYLAFFRSLIGNAGIERFEIWEGEQAERFGTHSLRRGGAQALALAGWSIDNIKFFGRWLSAAIEAYLLDIPFKVKGHLLAKSMVSSWKGDGERDIAFQVTKPCRSKTPARGDRLRVCLPADPSDQDTQASGWYDTIVVGTHGFVFQTLANLVSKLTILDNELRSVNLTPPSLPGVCSTGWIVVRPFPIVEKDHALCFSLASVAWIRF